MAARSSAAGGPSPRIDRSPIAVTREQTSIPKRPSSWRASAPSATVAAVDRALARSRASRASSKPYLSRPGRSAWPGRGRVKRGPPRDVGDIEILPVLVVLVPDDERDGGAERQPAPDPGEELGAVGLDLHATAAAVALLAPGQLGVDPGEIERQAGREALGDGGQRRPV